MPKYSLLDDYITTFNQEALLMYHTIKQVMFELNSTIKERLFAGQLAFYIEENVKRTFHESPVVVLAFYSDHVNVFASGNLIYKDKLPDYTFTKKGTMQIYYDKKIHTKYLSLLFKNSLQ